MKGSWPWAGERRWELLRGPLGMIAASGVLTLAMAAAVLPAPAERLFGSEIVGRHPAPFVMIARFEQPTAPGLYTQPATDYPGSALAWLLGDGVAAYNALVLASFPLAALFAFLLAVRLTGSRLAAWVAGLAYAFAPLHVAHAAYHPHVAQTQWLPLYLLALWLSLERASWPRLALLAGSAALVVLSNFYNGMIAALLTPLALIAFWAVQRGDVPRPARQMARTAALLALVAAAGLGWVAAFAPRVLSSPATLAFPRRELFDYSARWWSYLLPPLEHPLAGDWVRRFWEQRGTAGLLEHQVTIGLGLILLAAVAVVSWRRARRLPLLRAVPALGAVGAGAFLFSLSPELGLGPLSLPRPSGLVHELLPMFRAYARFGLVVMLATAVLAGVGTTLLARRRSPAATAAAAALLALAVIELTPFPPWRGRHVLPTTAHRWLDRQPGPLRVRDCVGVADPAGRHVAPFFAHALEPLAGHEDCADPGFVEAQAAGGASHLLVWGASPLGRWLDGRPPLPGTRVERRFDDALVLAVEAEAPRIVRRFAAGFSWREYREAETYRWMGRRGSLRLDNRTDAPLEIAVDLVLHSFPGERAVTPRLDGRELPPLRVTTEPRPHSLGTLRLAPGRHLLELETAEPAVVADEVLGNGDRRELAVALWDWELRPVAGGP